MMMMHDWLATGRIDKPACAKLKKRGHKFGLVDDDQINREEEKPKAKIKVSRRHHTHVGGLCALELNRFYTIFSTTDKVM